MFLGRKFTDFTNSGLMVWPVFAICFLASQTINPWSILPQYSGWHVFGFPLIYFEYQEGVGYVYFNIAFLILNLVIWYFISKLLVFGYRQLTKYRVIKPRK
jgi:hypothetical protein